MGAGDLRPGGGGVVKRWHLGVLLASAAMVTAAGGIALWTVMGPQPLPEPVKPRVDVGPLVDAALHSTERKGPRLAALRLRELGAEARRAVPPLRDALRDSRALIRGRAADALGLIGPEAGEAVPALISVLKDEDAGVRMLVALALGNIGAASAVPALVESLAGDAEWAVRMNSAAALGEMGATASAAVPALVAALSDRNRNVRFFAAAALERIRPSIPRAQGRPQRSRT